MKVTREHLQASWTALVETAVGGGLITFGDLRDRVVETTGLKLPAVGVGGLLLDPIWEQHCQPRGWPDVTWLVVRNDTKQPARKFLDLVGGVDAWQAQLERVRSFDWPARLPSVQRSNEAV